MPARSNSAKFRDQVHQAVVVTGSDGYSVVLALGEISPEFEGKQVIVAGRQDGQPLGVGHFRLVVPGEKRAGRSARDLVRISVIAPRPELGQGDALTCACTGGPPPSASRSQDCRVMRASSRAPAPSAPRASTATIS